MYGQALRAVREVVEPWGNKPEGHAFRRGVEQFIHAVVAPLLPCCCDDLSSVLLPFFCFCLLQSVTLLKLNTAVGQDLSASLSLSIVDLLDAHRSTLDRVIIAAAVQPPKRHQVRLALCDEF